jgi:hypothetical protein
MHAVKEIDWVKKNKVVNVMMSTVSRRRKRRPPSSPLSSIVV